MQQGWRRLVVCAGLAALCASAGAQRRSYEDSENGVRFSYPARWILNGDDDAATAKLRLALSAEAQAVVTLEGNFAGRAPYQGTDFEDSAFSYGVKDGWDQQRCLASPGKAGGRSPQPVSVDGLHGMKAEGRFAIEGTQDTHQMMAVYGGGRCYLFETVIVSRTPGEVKRPLRPEAWDRLKEEVGSILRSVRIRPVAGR